MYEKEAKHEKIFNIPPIKPGLKEEFKTPDTKMAIITEKTGNDLRYNGEITIQVPKSLHRELDERAKDEGVTLEQYIIYILAR